MGTEPVEYCRAIESYLCQKNDGHLIRVVGPSFELVSRWEAEGVPLKVAFRGIDRYFERYYRKGARRRPVRIDFCDADVRDVFDEWRRAVGLAAAAGPLDSENDARRGASLPAHLERVTLKLSSARAMGRLDESADQLIDRVVRELDAAREPARGLRGEARAALIARLSELDRELVDLARSTLDQSTRDEIEREADDDLADFRSRLVPDAYRRAREAAIDRAARDRLGLPTLTY